MEGLLTPGGLVGEGGNVSEECISMILTLEG